MKEDGVVVRDLDSIGSKGTILMIHKIGLPGEKKTKRKTIKLACPIKKGSPIKQLNTRGKEISASESKVISLVLRPEKNLFEVHTEKSKYRVKIIN